MAERKRVKSVEGDLGSGVVQIEKRTDQLIDGTALRQSGLELLE